VAAAGALSLLITSTFIADVSSARADDAGEWRYFGGSSASIDTRRSLKSTAIP